MRTAHILLKIALCPTENHFATHYCTTAHILKNVSMEEAEQCLAWGEMSPCVNVRKTSKKSFRFYEIHYAIL